MRKIAQFISRAMRLTKRKADDARQAILDLDLPKQAETDMLVTIQRYEDGGLAKWRFNMFSPAQCLMIWDAIRDGENPHETRHVFDVLVTHIETNTGVVTLTREEIAGRVRTTPNEVSRAMGRLEKLGAVIRERVKIPGMKGPGKAQYRINPYVGWNGSLEHREEAARVANQRDLLFEVIDGGGDSAA
jgi:CRP-like cAMP-binding protein